MGLASMNMPRKVDDSFMLVLMMTSLFVVFVGWGSGVLRKLGGELGV